MDKLWWFLGSVRLTLGSLLSLAAYAAVGTLPEERGLVADPFHHPVFAIVLLLLGLNVAFCSGQRFAARRRAAPGSVLSCRSLSDAALHLSLLVILCSGVFKGLGEVVLTQNIHVGGSTRTAYDWRARADVPLGFTLAVVDFVEEPYPVLARIAVSRRDTGERISQVELREGGETVLPGPGLRLRLTEFRRRDGVAHLEVGEPGSAGSPVALSTRGDEGRVAEYGPYLLTVLAYKSQPRSVRSRLSIREGGATVREGWLAPNGRMLHGGLRLSMTAWGLDRDGRGFVGIQMVRNPGAPLFWAGCVLLAIAVPVCLACRRRAKATPPVTPPS